MPEATTSTQTEKAAVPAVPPVAEIVSKLDEKEKKEPEAVKEKDETKMIEEKSDVEKHLDEHGWAIQYHPKLPYSYKLTKYGEIYTTVERLGRPKEKINIKRTIRQKYATVKRVLPLFLRFTRETSLPLGKRRIVAYLLGNILLSVIPSWQSRANWQLTDLTSKAIETRALDKLGIAKAAAVDIACYLAEKLLKEPIEENKARLQYRFRALIKERILLARIRLDAITSSDERVRAKIRSASQLLAENWRSAMLLEHLSNIISTTSALISQGLLLKTMAGTDHAQVATVSFAANLLFSISYMRDGFSRFDTAITDDLYRRMSVMQNLSENAGNQDQLLGLRSYYLREYQAAAAKIGDVSTREPDVYSDEWTSPWKTRIVDIARRANDSLLYFLFAIQTIARPQRTLGDAAAAMSDLHLIKSATSDFSNQLVKLIKHFRAISKVMQPIEQFYSLDQIKPLLKLRENPVPYQSVQPLAKTVSALSMDVDLRSEDGTLVNDTVPATPVEPRKTGMKIEFRNVCFKYPSAKKLALDNVSFIIYPGELVSIVGFSGSGKSSLIALLVRLVEPDSGQVLINDIDITSLDPEELYTKISMLFQTTDKADLTINEFIRLGDVKNATDEDVIASAKASGAHEIIMKLKKGYKTELGARHWWGDSVSIGSLVKRNEQNDEWEDRYYGKVHEGENDDNDKDVDESTDEDSRKILEAANTELIQPTPELLKLTKRAARYSLPEPHRLEGEMLKEGYNPDKEEPDNDPGAKFSGGEWAKVVMARTLLRKNVDLLICDEFSAALDPLSESQIFNKFLERLGTCTLLAVTHRFHLACRSDRILFMKDGKLLENGSHAELMKLGKEYKEMYSATSAPDSHKKEVACQAGDADEAGDEKETEETTSAEITVEDIVAAPTKEDKVAQNPTSMVESAVLVAA